MVTEKKKRRKKKKRAQDEISDIQSQSDLPQNQSLNIDDTNLQDLVDEVDKAVDGNTSKTQ